MLIGMGDLLPAVSLHGVMKLVVVVELYTVTQLMDNYRINLNRGAFHQVHREIDVLIVGVETPERRIAVRNVAIRVAQSGALCELLESLGEIFFGS